MIFISLHAFSTSILQLKTKIAFLLTLRYFCKVHGNGATDMHDAACHLPENNRSLLFHHTLKFFHEPNHLLLKFSSSPCSNLIPVFSLHFFTFFYFLFPPLCSCLSTSVLGLYNSPTRVAVMEIIAK
jgi:hypothetical protein